MSKKREDARRQLEDYCRRLGHEYRINSDPTSVWADIYRDVDDRHDIEVLNYMANLRAGTNVVQVNLWCLPNRTMLVSVTEVPNDPVIVRRVCDRLARTAQDPSVDELCARCCYADLDSLFATTGRS